MVAAVGIQVNLMLMALNLLPIPPLDGAGSWSASCPIGWPGRSHASSPTAS